MKIMDLENRTGLDRATIRFYEREGLLCPKRLENGYREYSEEDAGQLLKIKLLRQLGLPVGKILELQQGSADFSATMEDQIRELERQVDDRQRAKAVCTELRADGVDYQSMDAEHYLNRLSELPPEFSEPVQEEIHPVRRFVARMIDGRLLAAVVNFILIVILRIRPVPMGFLNQVLTCAIWAMLIPIDALALHFWGTTPGKWIMGIRVEHYRGGTMPISTAMQREWRAFVFGTGCMLPYLDIICMGYQFCRLTGRSLQRFARYDEVEPPRDMSWDEETELIYSNWNGRGKWLAAAVCFCLLLTVATVADGIRPKYRGDELTVAQFAANYNAVLSVIDENAGYQRMRDDGSWYPEEDGSFTVYIGGVPVNEDLSFTYETEGGFVRRVRYDNSYENVFYLSNPIDGQCSIAVMSVMVAQDWFDVTDVAELSEILDECVDQQSGHLQYENLEIIWDSVTENCSFSGGAFMAEEEDANAKLHFSFELRIKNG